jgi:hypothetical protein
VTPIEKTQRPIKDEPMKNLIKIIKTFTKTFTNVNVLFSSQHFMNSLDFGENVLYYRNSKKNKKIHT